MSQRKSRISLAALRGKGIWKGREVVEKEGAWGAVMLIGKRDFCRRCPKRETQIIFLWKTSEGAFFDENERREPGVMRRG